jgi:hypothetical protein
MISIKNETVTYKSVFSSLLIANTTIKSSNIEIKKELLLAKERKIEIQERINNGEKKYQQLWLEAQSRYESIPFVEKLLQAQNETKSLQESILRCGTKSLNLKREILMKEQFLLDADKRRLIELADYLINILPHGMKTLCEKINATNEIRREIDRILNEESVAKKCMVTVKQTPKQQIETELQKSLVETSFDDGWFNIYQTDNTKTLKVI